MTKSKRVAFCAVMAALAIVFGYLESLISIPFSVPGVKLGLGNIAVLVCLYHMNKKTAFLVMLIKVIVSGLLFSTHIMLLYSLFGGLLSFVVMGTLKKLNFGIFSVSVGGGVFHNIGQLICACTLLENINAFYYAPILIVAGVVCGIIVGAVSDIIIKRTAFIFKEKFDKCLETSDKM